MANILVFVNKWWVTGQPSLNVICSVKSSCLTQPLPPVCLQNTLYIPLNNVLGLAIYTLASSAWQWDPDGQGPRILKAGIPTPSAKPDSQHLLNKYWLGVDKKMTKWRRVFFDLTFIAHCYSRDTKWVRYSPCFEKARRNNNQKVWLHLLRQSIMLYLRFLACFMY